MVGSWGLESQTSTVSIPSRKMHCAARQGSKLHRRIRLGRELGSLSRRRLVGPDHYHCVERVQIEANLKHLNLGALGEVVKLPVELWQTGCHKDEELAADREGMSLAVRAGYSPYGQIQLLQRLAKPP